MSNNNIYELHDQTTTLDSSDYSEDIETNSEI